MGPPEQTIEDILASIRRVMVDDEPRTAAAADTPPDEEGDELELDRPVAAPGPAGPVLPPAPPAMADPVSPVAPASAPRTLVSSDTAAASRQALAYLSTLRLGSAEPADDSLQGLVRELLKPMLKAWLDAELPAIVERMVVQEIARLTAGR